MEGIINCNKNSCGDCVLYSIVLRVIKTEIFICLCILFTPYFGLCLLSDGYSRQIRCIMSEFRKLSYKMSSLGFINSTLKLKQVHFF